MKSIALKPSFVMLAPMEGIIDHQMRSIFASIGGLDRCVTEFIRVVGNELPERVFRRYFPEIDNHSLTGNDVPVFAQLLGDNPEAMATNAAKLARMGAAGIDINFGCPAKTVNNNGGGSVLLQYPERLHQIVSHIRGAVPAEIPVTAKIRLGYKDKSLVFENVDAIESGGANQIAVHARTKLEGYKPPAHWHYIQEIVNRVSIPVIANGEVWNLGDVETCLRASGTDQIMLGRGLVASPELALLSKDSNAKAAQWGDICLLLIYYLRSLEQTTAEKHQPNLVKQWLVYLRERFADAFLLFEQVKRLKHPLDVENELRKAVETQVKAGRISGTVGNLNLTHLL
ncbi:tRNA-dihydrouridine(16) synthase [BD1-7 clade bacterium]|uniref:tRNA-dihydrouridine(16) synthase n=1 Tax=BD1-7 clade bacterium TaxID=2029982 RepID=A0A5S9PQR9_9GAMM|nr:tRNA-dihydrouridine(16) synthase [BD1-7 clade bacterium]CAA0106407.1 tRNA-dihydrouridine(16) synthase [BD1-7 clade bacterium]